VVEIGGKRLIKLRNPWSSETYCGICSDEDTDFWSSNNKKALKHEIQDDGVFYITVECFWENMLYAVVSYYE